MKRGEDWRERLISKRRCQRFRLLNREVRTAILRAMVITYHGMDFFRVQFADLVIAVNPISKQSKLPTSRFGADIALISMNHADLNGIEQVSFGEKKPFVIEGPGEYEVKEVFIKGFASGKSLEGMVNTIYKITLEGMNVCTLGALPSIDIDASIKSSLGDIDVLFMPIGGESVITGSEAEKLAVALEPKIIIPMHYREDATGSAALKAFLKESGAEKVEATDKLTLKKKDLEGKEGEVVVLKATH